MESDKSFKREAKKHKENKHFELTRKDLSLYYVELSGKILLEKLLENESLKNFWEEANQNSVMMSIRLFFPPRSEIPQGVSKYLTKQTYRVVYDQREYRRIYPDYKRVLTDMYNSYVYEFDGGKRKRVKKIFPEIEYYPRFLKLEIDLL